MLTTKNKTHKRLEINERPGLHQKLGAWTRCTGRVSVLCFSWNTRRVAHMMSCPVLNEEGKLWQRKQVISHVWDGHTIFVNKFMVATIEFLERWPQSDDNITLFQQLVCQKLGTVNKVRVFATSSSISYKLWNVDPIGRGGRNVATEKWKIDNLKREVIALVIQLRHELSLFVYLKE